MNPPEIETRPSNFQFIAVICYTNRTSKLTAAGILKRSFLLVLSRLDVGGHMATVFQPDMAVSLYLACRVKQSRE